MNNCRSISAAPILLRALISKVLALDACAAMTIPVL
jgi:hypothetical protein